MLRKYRKIDPVEAEQFDGSPEMMEKYHITDDGFGETYTFRLDNNALPLKRGWWIVYKGTSEFLGLTLVYWRTMPDDKFRQTYREEDGNGEFEFTSYQPNQPNWFKRLEKAGMVLVNTEPDPIYEDEDQWYLHMITIAYLWTPDGIAIACEGDTIVNHGTYCEPEQNDL